MEILDKKNILKIAICIVKNAASQIQKNPELYRLIDCDMPRDVKVNADYYLDEIISMQLTEKTDYPVISEEKIESHNIIDGYQWIVDPLDGSLNYNRNIPFCCISVALWKGLEPYLGVIYDFNKDELFTGTVSSECELNGVNINPSIVSEKSKAVLASGFPRSTNFNQEVLLEFVRNIKKFKKIRLLGSAALSLAYVACGRVDFYLEKNIKIWDVAAGLALIKSAGGMVNFSSPKEDMTMCVEASNPFLLK